MTRPLAEWEQRARQHGAYPSNPYESFRRRNPQDPAAKRNTELIGLGLSIVPVVRGARLIQSGVKGARRVRVGRYGERFYDPVRRGFISKVEYQRRLGASTYLKEGVKATHRGYKRAVTYPARKFPRTVGAIGKGARTHALLTGGPLAYLKSKYLPPWIVAGMWGYAWYRSLDPSNGDGSIPGNVRVPPVISRLDRSGEPMPLVSPKPFHQHRQSKVPSQGRRCPPGHRWSSKARKCVPVRRDRG